MCLSKTHHNQVVAQMNWELTLSYTAHLLAYDCYSTLAFDYATPTISSNIEK